MKTYVLLHSRLLKEIKQNLEIQDKEHIFNVILKIEH